MHVYFWGTRGSLPASITAETVRAKVIKAIKKAGGHQFVNDEDRTVCEWGVTFSYAGELWK
jgi:hypothetical protein